MTTKSQTLWKDRPNNFQHFMMNLLKDYQDHAHSEGDLQPVHSIGGERERGLSSFSPFPSDAQTVLKWNECINQRLDNKIIVLVEE